MSKIKEAVDNAQPWQAMEEPERPGKKKFEETKKKTDETKSKGREKSIEDEMEEVGALYEELRGKFELLPEDAPCYHLDKWGIPEGFPTQPIGRNGRTFYVIDPSGTCTGYTDREITNTGILKTLAGAEIDKLAGYWPKWNVKKTNDKNEYPWLRNDFDATKMANSILKAFALRAAQEGVFDPAERLRGRGAWIDDDGNLVYHFGDEVRVYAEGKEKEVFSAGEHGRYIYTKKASLEKPVAAAEADLSGIDELTDLLASWNWRDPFGYILFLGWIAAGFIGGALPWRPHIWLVGDGSCGKSKLNELVKGLMGKNFIYNTDYTEASIRLQIADQHLPVLMDECESRSEDSPKMRALMNLARSTATGGIASRGSSDQKSIQYEIKSSFYFSSIYHPPLRSEELQRICVLPLSPLTKQRPSNFLSEYDLGKIGQVIRARILFGFDRFKPVFEAYSAKILELTNGSRNCDVYGTLLACAKIVMSDAAELDQADMELVEEIFKSGKMIAGNASKGENQAAMIQHLMGSEINKWKGGDITTVGNLIYQAIDRAQAVGTRDDANNILKMRGMRVKLDMVNGQDELFIANSHPALIRIFKDTEWYGEPRTTGKWIQVFCQYPGAHTDNKSVRLSGGCVTRGVWVPIAELGIGKGAADIEEE